MINVIIVDDERLMLQGFLHSINWNNYGYHIAGACENAETALEICKNEIIDIALLDINMPGMNGLELLKELKTIHPDMIVIILTAYEKFQFAREAMRLKADEYLLKPEIEFEDILQTMNKFKDRIVQNKKTLLNNEDEGAALEGRFYENNHIILCTDKYSEKHYVKILDESVKTITDLIDVNNLLELNKKISEVMNIFQSYNVPKDYVNKYVLEIIFLLIFKVNELNGNIDDILNRNNFNPYSEIARFLPFAHLRSWFEEIYEAIWKFLAECLEKDYQSIVFNALKYINENFYQEDLTLNTVAMELHVSYAYLSQLFSQQTGEGFNKYLTRLRMEKAIKHIMSGSIKLNRIAEMVGYKNLSYFIKVFKKYTGTTPYSYRIKK